jgi:hypothetical protein
MTAARKEGADVPNHRVAAAGAKPVPPQTADPGLPGCDADPWAGSVAVPRTFTGTVQAAPPSLLADFEDERTGMSSGSEPVPLSGRHRDTVRKILQHPVSHNIEWQEVLQLLEEVGTVVERHDGKFTVTVGGETEIFERPRHKDIDAQQVVDLRRMLTNAGYQ